MRLVNLLAVAGIVLAGCTIGPETPTDDSAVGVVTDPKDDSYNTSAGYHIHDYWGGQETLSVLDATQSYYFTNNGGSESRWPTRFYPDDGKTIPQGTGNITVTVTWSHTDVQEAQSRYGDLELWIKTAQENEAHLVADDVRNGEAIRMAIGYDDADLPHQLISAWEFQVHVRGTDGFPRNHFEGSIQVEVDAHRGLELRAFPPHPDHWRNRTEFLLADDERDFTQTNWPNGGFNGNFDQRIRPLNGTLVPWGTDRVELSMSWENDAPVGGLRLWFHGADTRQHTKIEPVHESASSAEFEIDVGKEMADGPYSNASLWEFVVTAPHDPSDEPTFNGRFSLTADVIRQ